MPNGGIPLRMLLFPRHNKEYCIFSEGFSASLYMKKDWEKLGRDAPCLLTLTADELLVLQSYVGHHVDEKIRPVYHRPGVEVFYE